MLGLLEYIVDLDVLFTHLRHAKCDLVLSYCVTDLTDRRSTARRSAGSIISA